MALLSVFFIFLFGLAVGSFLNVLIYRLPREEKISGRSKCPNCNKTLEWRELIPLISFMWQGGKCRSCHSRISWQYPLVELATALLFVFIPKWGQSPLLGIVPTIDWLLATGYWLLIASVLIVIFVTDLRYYIIPDKVVFSAIGVALLYNLFEWLRISNFEFVWNLEFEIWNLRPLADHLFFGPIIAGLLVSLFFLSLVACSKGRWMGLGDVKLAFFMGLVLGFPNIFVAFFFAFMFGSIVGIILVAMRKKRFQSQLPFGTFLSLATFIALFWGDKTFDFYWNVIL